MGKINTGRVIIGGLVAGIVGDIFGYLVDGLWLAPQWNDGMKALGRTEIGASQILWFNVIGLVLGIATIWIYAGIRPRFGAGPKTAVLAGLAVWIVGALLPNFSSMWVSGLFSHSLTVMTTAGALVATLIAAVAGAAVYKEPAV
jgi:hypothetical protein